MDGWRQWLSNGSIVVGAALVIIGLGGGALRGRTQPTGSQTEPTEAGLPTAAPSQPATQESTVEPTAPATTALEEPTVEASRTASPSPTAVAQEEPEAFIARFNDALADADVDLLVAMLHPQVLDIYSVEECTAYLESVVEGSPPVNFRRTLDSGPYTYEAPAGTAVIDPALSVEIDRDVNGNTVIQETHYAHVDGLLRWFTVCEQSS